MPFDILILGEKMKNVVVGIISKKRSDSEKEYLLVSVKDESYGEYSGYYYPPGGHVENGEDEAEALKREFKEELNLTVSPLSKIALTKSDVGEQTTSWWECDLPDGEIDIAETKILDAGFFTKSEMENMKVWPATKKFFDTYIFDTYI